MSKHQSEDGDFDHSQSYQGNSSEHHDHSEPDLSEQTFEQRRSQLEATVIPQLTAVLEKMKSRNNSPPSPVQKQKPTVAGMSDTGPEQEKEYEGTWQTRKMVRPQPLPGMPTADMAAAAAQKYNEKKESIQKAVRELEGEEVQPEQPEKPEQVQSTCCIIL